MFFSMEKTLLSSSLLANLLLTICYILFSISCSQPVQKPESGAGDNVALHNGINPNNTGDLGDDGDNGDGTGTGGGTDSLGDTGGDPGADAEKIAKIVNRGVKIYYAATDSGNFAKIKIDPKTSSQAGFFTIEIAFTATREIKHRKRHGYCPQNNILNKCSYSYASLIVTLPASSYIPSIVTDAGDYIKDSTQDGEQYTVTLDKTMKKGNSFRLKFDIIASYLTAETLPKLTRFNVEFDGPYTGRQQFESREGETPMEGTFH